MDVRGLRREPFFDALEASAGLLEERLGSGMGEYLSLNIVKFRRSPASLEETDYGLWLRSELPLHAANGYRDYVDASAWMANLWVGRYLEFMAEFFAQLETGCETSTAFLNAHTLTLQKHHNIFVSMAFRAGSLRLPSRADFLACCAGGAPHSVVMCDVADFVRIVRQVAIFCLEMDAELDSLGKSSLHDRLAVTTLSTPRASQLELPKELETHAADYSSAPDCAVQASPQGTSFLEAGLAC